METALAAKINCLSYNLNKDFKLPLYPIFIIEDLVSLFQI